jgi:hypothetical protein
MTRTPALSKAGTWLPTGLRTCATALVLAVLLVLLPGGTCNLALAVEAKGIAGAAHELRVVLEPETGRITGQSDIALPPGSGGVPDILLHPRMSVRSVNLDGQPARFSFAAGRLRPEPDPSRPAPTRLAVEFEGRFPDPVPTAQFGSDNPGGGVAASITPAGVFLQGGSGWHPALPGQAAVVRLTVEAPQGFLAVTSGRLLGHQDRDGRTVSRWEARTAGGLPLSAGPFSLERMETGTVPVLTYLLPGNADLSRTYLEASARHLAYYERLHGPYPFDHFAVVENFFPTGYGMPSYTLLGSTVLRLPFIPETSLRHEVAHCWWGNGVLVDHSRGNWSEGLTTYVADHAAQEEASADAAREYRLRVLRDYAQLAAGRQDFPLSRFRSRSDPATQAVGYGKAMFVVHMIRQRLGDEPFREGLRSFYRQWLFREASWPDMFEAFEGQGWDREESRAFLRQWILEPGAPDLVLDQVEVRELGEEWEVDGTLRQRGAVYGLRVPVRLETEGVPLEMTVSLDGPETHFTMAAAHRPRRLTADPDCHVFRLLDPSEIPPTVNSVKGAASLAVIVGEEMGRVSPNTLQGFLSSLNQPAAKVLTEKDAEGADLSGSSLLFFGYPRSPLLQRLIAPPGDYGLEPGGGWFAETVHPAAARLDAIFVTMPDAQGGSGVTALFRTRPELDEARVVDAARRVTHYGKESYLGFEGGRNRLRGAWSPLRSPLTVEFRP